MEQVKQWAVTICITLAATGLFSMLIPRGSMERVMSFAIRVFFLCSLLLPFFGELPELQLDPVTTASIDDTALEETMQEQLKRLSESNVEQVVKSILEAEEVETEKIEADIHISEDHSVSINKVTVVLSDESSAQIGETERLLRQQTGLEIEVTGPVDGEKDGSVNG